MFVSGCTHGDIKLWDTDVKLLHAQKNAHDLGVTCLSFAPTFNVGEFSVHSGQLFELFYSFKAIVLLGNSSPTVCEHDSNT